VKRGHWGIAAGGLLAALALVATGCGDDDGGGEELTLSEYFLNVEEIRQDYQLDARDLQLELEGVDQSDEDSALEGLRAYYEASQATFEGAIDQVEALDPPSEAEEPHDTFVEAGRQVVVETTAVYEDLQEAETVEEANELLEDTPDADGAAEAFNAACRDLQAVADREGIAAGLGCEEEE
jgi:hypothetical protein